jgi:hypothetical protein
MSIMPTTAVENGEGRPSEKFSAQMTRQYGAAAMKRAVSMEALSLLLDQFIEAHRAERTRATAREEQLLKRIELLEARRVSGRWCGPHEKGRRYLAGEEVSRGGIWLALKDTDETPAFAPDAWVLRVRGPRDK